MPSPDLAEERRQFSIALLEFSRGMRLFIAGAEYLEGMMDESLIAAAIVLGQVERKLLTASDIAHYTGIPRPSVIRKLRHLSAVKDLRTRKNGSRIGYFFADVNGPDAIAGFLYRVRLIKKLCTAVSKMDIDALEHSYANNYASNQRNVAQLKTTKGCLGNERSENN